MVKLLKTYILFSRSRIPEDIRRHCHKTRLIPEDIVNSRNHIPDNFVFTFHSDKLLVILFIVKLYARNNIFILNVFSSWLIIYNTNIESVIKFVYGPSWLRYTSKRVKQVKVFHRKRCIRSPCFFLIKPIIDPSFTARLKAIKKINATVFPAKEMWT